MRLALFALIILAVLALLILLRIVAASRRQKKSRSHASVMGAIGIAETDLESEGLVLIGSEVWRAKTETAIRKGNRVRVAAIEGVLLQVEPIADCELRIAD